jgi:hypothetical protein
MRVFPSFRSATPSVFPDETPLPLTGGVVLPQAERRDRRNKAQTVFSVFFILTSKNEVRKKPEGGQASFPSLS